MANIKEQIQEGQHRANQLVEKVKEEIGDIKKYFGAIGVQTFVDELQSQLGKISKKV